MIRVALSWASLLLLLLLLITIFRIRRGEHCNILRYSYIYPGSSGLKAGLCIANVLEDIMFVSI